MGILIPELYPTHLRSTGPGVCQNLGKGIGGMMGPPAAGAGFESWLSDRVVGVAWDCLPRSHLCHLDTSRSRWT